MAPGPGPGPFPSLPCHRHAVLGAPPSEPPPRPNGSTHQRSGAPRPWPQVLGGAVPSRRFQPELLPRRPRPPVQPSQRAGPAAKASPRWGPEMVPAFLMSFYHVSEQRATVGQHLDRATGQEAHTHTSLSPGLWKRKPSQGGHTAGHGGGGVRTLDIRLPRCARPWGKSRPPCHSTIL